MTQVLVKTRHVFLGLTVWTETMAFQYTQAQSITALLKAFLGFQYILY